MDVFHERGYFGPVPILSPGECRKLLEICRHPDASLTPDWPKALAVGDPEVFRIAVRPAILEIVRQYIGRDIMLWGACFVRRKPGQVHHWHNDIESSVPQGKTVSVWIGIEHSEQGAALQLISRSHHFRKTIQEVRHQAGIAPGQASAEDVLQWARTLDEACLLEQPDVRDGQGIFFDGWLWHATYNRTRRWRTALLLQYATPDTPIRMPDPNSYEWPFRTLAYPKPPCMMVSGSDMHHVNRQVPPPVVHDGVERHEVGTVMYSLDLPLLPNPGESWKPFGIVRGATPNLQALTIHASALLSGATPHPPHHHREDELLLILSGEADVTLPDLAATHGETTVRLQSGDFVFYPAWFYHTITGRSHDPVNYLMLKWYNKSVTEDANGYLEYGRFQFREHVSVPVQTKTMRTQIVFSGETACLKHFQCHTTVLQPGAGYTAHVDAHDVAIIVISGWVESMGTQHGPHSVLFFSAGQPHDMWNPSQELTSYLVFEFHGTHPKPVKRMRRTLWQKMQDPKSWRDKWEEIRTRYLSAGGPVSE